ncbi:hypothetical protein EJB05_33824, partial [Eragrostis curvula]
MPAAVTRQRTRSISRVPISTEYGAERPSMGGVLWCLEYALQLQVASPDSSDADSMDLVPVTPVWFQRNQLSRKEKGKETLVLELPFAHRDKEELFLSATPMGSSMPQCPEGAPPQVIAMDVENDDYEGYSWVDPSGFYLPGTPAPMCYCGDLCKMRVSGLYKTYWQRYWCCANEDGDRSVDAPWTPPPICDLKERIDTEHSELATEVVERKVTAKRISWENEARVIAERERKEAKERERAEERKEEAEEREKEREKKRARAHRAKQALQEGGSQAVRKGKWPRSSAPPPYLSEDNMRAIGAGFLQMGPEDLSDLALGASSSASDNE